MKQIILPESGQRLDLALVRLLPDYSRSYIQKLCEAGQVTLAGKALKASWKTVQGARLEIKPLPAQPTSLKAQAIPLDIVFEDEWLAVVNKPQGMVVHPGAGNQENTLANALLAHFADDLSSLAGSGRPGIVHRIDKDTSGLLLVVKDNHVHAKVSAKLRRHEIERVYQALVYGRVLTKNGIIEAPIGRDPRQRQKMAVVATGKPARTHFRTCQAADQASWLEVRLETGRTHQIRVHLSYIGHPVLADPLYAAKRPAFGLAGQALHAGRLGFVHPVTGQSLQFDCPVPAYFSNLADELLC